MFGAKIIPPWLAVPELYTTFSHRTAGGRPAASIGGLRGTAGATKEPATASLRCITGASLRV